MQTIKFSAADGIGRLTLNRPDRLNAMTNLMVREVAECLDAVAQRKDVRVLVLTGAGRGFCPGADLKHFSEGGGDGGHGERDIQLTVEDFRVPVILHGMPQVTIAAINGACAGAGFGWACAADLRFAARGATFNSAFLNVASAGDMAGPWSLPRLVGAARARELYFLPGKFSADEALSYGLVTRVFAPEDFSNSVDALATQLAAASPHALLTMKQNFLDAEVMDLGTYYRVESERHQRVMAHDDAKEAFRAFLEKRPPQFGHNKSKA